MMYRNMIAVPLALGIAACGYSQEEMDKARAADKAQYEAEMAKMQAAQDAENQKNQEELASRQQMIGGLEKKVEDLGGDLASVRKDLGAELASTKSELSATNKEVEQLRKLREQAEKEAAQLRALTSKLKSMIDAGKLQVVMRDGRINLKLPDAILFPSGSTRLKKGGQDALKEVATVLKDVKGRDFLIAGHTDNVPLRRGGRYKDNWALSTARAVQVVRLMIKEGVEAAQLAAAGYGSYDPIASNDTPEGRKQNRRLEIILMPNLQNVDL